MDTTDRTLASLVAALALALAVGGCSSNPENGNGSGGGGTDGGDTDTECLTPEEAMTHDFDFSSDAEGPKCCPGMQGKRSCLLENCSILTCVPSDEGDYYIWGAAAGRCSVSAEEAPGDAGTPCPPPDFSDASAPSGDASSGDTN